MVVRGSYDSSDTTNKTEIKIMNDNGSVCDGGSVDLDVDAVTLGIFGGGTAHAAAMCDDGGGRDCRIR